MFWDNFFCVICVMSFLNVEENSPIKLSGSAILFLEFFVYDFNI